MCQTHVTNFKANITFSSKYSILTMNTQQSTYLLENSKHLFNEGEKLKDHALTPLSCKTSFQRTEYISTWI